MPEANLVNYNAARSALKKAVRVDEVKDIRNKARALQVYAMQAKDGQLAGDAAEIKSRATRRIGEIMEEMRQVKELAKGSRGKGPGRGKKGKKGGLSKNPPFPEKTLPSLGIDKNLAHAAREAAKMTEAKFEAQVAKTRSRAVAAAEGDTAIIAEARAERHTKKAEKRHERERELTKKIKALPDKKYAVILADPEWRFEFYSEKGKTNSSADNHYPTSALDEIKARNVNSIAAMDCVLFLWATAPMFPDALSVMKAWGFSYKSQFIWNKDRIGTGYWNRNKHELLLIGTRGNVPAPAMGTQFSSLIDAPVGKHSEKPEAFYAIIEKYFPTLPKIELNRRGPARAGWDAWGNEAEVAA